MKKIYLLLVFTVTVLTSHAQLVKLYAVIPNMGIVTICNFHQGLEDLSQYRLSGTGFADTPLYKLKVFAGKVDSVPGRTSIVFQNVPISKACGSLSIYLPGDTVNHIRGGLFDFMQYMCAGNENEDSAAILGLWKKGTYVYGGGPYSWNSNEFKRGVQYWGSAKLPIINIRFTKVSPWNNLIYIRNSGVSNIDMQYSTICINGTCYDSLKNAPVEIVRGNINLAKNDTLVFRVNGQPLDTIAGSLALFAFPNSTNDTTALLDFVQWGAANQPKASLAHQKGIWDSMEYVTIERRLDSLSYRGDYNRLQVGKKYWQSRNPIKNNLRFTSVSLWNDMIALKNVGDINLDLSNSAICINGNCYDSLKNAPITVVSGKLQLGIGDSLILRVSGLPIDTLKGSIAIFDHCFFKDTTELYDFVQWGQPSQPYSVLAHNKGIWDSSEFVSLIRREDSLRYIGDFSRMQSGNKYWMSLNDSNVGISLGGRLFVGVYPNPASNLIQINGLGLNHFQIMDIKGRLILSGDLNRNSNNIIETTVLKPGIYLLRVTDLHQASGTMKLIVVE